MYDEDWGQFIVIDDNKEELYYHYMNPQSCLYSFLYFTRDDKILRKSKIRDTYHSFEFIEILFFCFKNLLYGNH